MKPYHSLLLFYALAFQDFQTFDIVLHSSLDSRPLMEITYFNYNIIL